MSGISLQPFKNMGAMAGLFNVSSAGYTQGDAQDDPAVRLQLCSGVISDSVTAPLWGGVGVMECISVAGGVSGATIKKPTASNCNAFSVFNQAYHGISTPSSPVPQYLPGGSLHYYRIGSGARIPLPISPAVAGLADGTEPVGSDGFVWDLVNNCIDVYSSSTSGNPKVDIRLINVSTTGNLTVSTDTDGNVVWDDTMPVGLFLI
jgi:hypothetical protein